MVVGRRLLRGGRQAISGGWIGFGSGVPGGHESGNWRLPVIES